MNRRRAFTLKQAFLPVHYHLHFSPMREVCMRERSSLWWEEVAVNFSQQARVQNFRVSHDTFT